MAVRSADVIVRSVASDLFAYRGESGQVPTEATVRKTDANMARTAAGVCLDCDRMADGDDGRCRWCRQYARSCENRDIVWMEGQHKALVRLAGKLHDSYGGDDPDATWAILGDLAGILEAVRGRLGKRVALSLVNRYSLR